VTAVQSARVDHGRVPSRAAAWLAWALCAVCVILGILGLVYGAWNYESLDEFLTDVGPLAMLALSFPVVGALIATHRPRNPLGWVFCGVGLSEGLMTFGLGYGVYALQTAPGTVPGGPLAIWLAHWAWVPGAGLLGTFVLLLFPDGRLPSRRWRPVAWLSAVLIALTSGMLATLLWPLRGPALLDPRAEGPLGARLVMVLTVGYVLVQLLGLACLVALLLRFRRARGVERQQLKWFLFAGVITVASLLATQQPGLRLLSVLLVPAIPVAAGIAILRYRLYDIDRIISRTLSYGLLSAILGLGYAGVVLLLGQLFGGIGAEPPGWAIAGATLAVAALFQPARRRIQAAVDRRFNRRRYDAARTIEAFSARLRDQIDLDTLSAELLAVVDQTMEPTQGSLWLRPAAHGSSGTPRGEAQRPSWAY
jgi:hypothetical protein